MKIAVLGGGNMGGAIAAGAIAAAVVKDTDVSISHAREALTKRLENINAHPLITKDNTEAVKGADIIFVAVKPWLAEGVLREIAPLIDPTSQCIASVVAGVPFSTLASYFETPPAMYRVIPNTAVSLSQSATFISKKNTSALQDQMIESIFIPLGETFMVKEEQMTAVTALASCGIAYILKYIDAATAGGVELGVERSEAQKIVMQTVRGALALLDTNGTTPQQEIDKVTTPGGITLKGLEEMQRSGFAAAVINGLLASK
ncbi:MAG: pyrroline-5-carboxylate reductase [Flavobacteriales bacterium]|nr:pyrroline-5-carboxylate reductase [Flavobacteriales bacterium]